MPVCLRPTVRGPHQLVGGIGPYHRQYPGASPHGLPAGTVPLSTTDSRRTSFWFHGALYELSPAVVRERAGALLERLGLEAHRGRRLREFSKEMLHRIGLAQALLCAPDLIFLDEPASGLDPGGRRLARDLILEQRRRGSTVFVSSHLLSEIPVTCDRVAFLNHGAIVKVVDLAGALHDSLTLRATARNIRPEVHSELEGLATAVRLEGDHLTLRARNEACVPEIARLLAGHCDDRTAD
jgi:ABC-2 type transport system ATP-binding protein